MFIININLNYSKLLNLSGSIKFISVHNSSILFYIGVPVNNKYLLQGNYLNNFNILFF